MKLTEEDLAFMRRPGLYVKEKCDNSACRRVLIQSFRYTFQDDPRVFCSADCRNSQLLEKVRHRKTLEKPVAVLAEAV